MRRRVFNPVQMNRYEPCVIYLLRHVPLDVLQRVLPNDINAHIKPQYTGLFTPVDNYPPTRHMLDTERW